MSQIVEITHVNGLGEWSISGGNALSWSAEGLEGTVGAMAIDAADGGQTTTAATVTFDAIATDVVRLKFALTKPDIVMPESASVRFVALARNSGAEDKVLLTVLNSSGVYYFGAYLLNDAGSASSDSGVVELDPFPRYLEVVVTKATNGTGADDATMTVYKDDGNDGLTSYLSVTGVDLYDDFDFDTIRMGKLTSAIGAPTSGGLVLDEVILRDDNEEIGGHSYSTTAEVFALRDLYQLPSIILPGRSGKIWKTRIKNDGAFVINRVPIGRVGGINHELALPLAQRSLMDTGNTSIWRVQVDDRDERQPTVEAINLNTTNAQHSRELSGFSDNGQEWKVTVESSGTLTLAAASSQWPVLPQPVLQTSAGLRALAVTDAGSLYVTDEIPQGHQLQDCNLRSQDHSTVWQVTIDDDLAVQTVDIT